MAIPARVLRYRDVISELMSHDSDMTDDALALLLGPVWVCIDNRHEPDKLAGVEYFRDPDEAEIWAQRIRDVVRCNAIQVVMLHPWQPVPEVREPVTCKVGCENVTELNGRLDLTEDERKAMESVDPTPFLGTIEDRLEVATRAAIRWMRRYNEVMDAAVDDHNWRGRVTHALVGDQPYEISSGRAVELIWKLKRNQCEKFRVRDARNPEEATRRGLCYSFYDHFDIHWDDGIMTKGVADLSYLGIFRDE